LRPKPDKGAKIEGVAMILKEFLDLLDCNDIGHEEESED